MRLSKVLKLESCTLNIKAKDKEESLKEISELMHKAPPLQHIDKETIFSALKQREDIGSTGFGKGIAIPHCQLDELDQFVVGIAISQAGVHFDAIDKKKVRCFAVLIGPKSDRSGHLQLLAKISSVFKESGIVDHLVKSESKIALYEEFLRNAENDLNIRKSRGRDKLMIMIVKDENIIEDITEIFLEYGIQDTTIIETQQMENLLSKVPLFMGFFNFTGDKNPYSKLILLKINKEYLSALIKSIEDRFGDLDNYSALSIMVLDLFFSKG